MSDKSPLFVSSLELIAHATELFAQKNSKKYKFIILHLANAVELILKDGVIDQGLSIYEKPGITINIWESIKKLQSKDIDIPELPVIELLIDDRNTIQHRFGHPTAESTYYYIEQVVSFFKRFLHHHYHTNLAEALKSHLSDEHLKLLGLVKDEFSILDQLASVSIEASVLRASNSIERELSDIIRSSIPDDLVRFTTPLWQRKSRTALLEDLRQKGFFHRDIAEAYSYLQEARNYAAHNPVDASDIKWQEAFDTAKEILTGLREAEKAGYIFTLNEPLLEDLQKHMEAARKHDEALKREHDFIERTRREGDRAHSLQLIAALLKPLFPEPEGNDTSVESAN
jgi:hypothetical protein